MSKYIRTQDGIHLKNIFLNETSVKEWNCLGYVVYKQADTIEELCDKFIGVEENGTPHIFAYECDLLDLIHNAERKLGTKVIGYGAVWTDKGLIYVAKLNSKGEMELL